MTKKTSKIAMVSPAMNAYSETFIQAQKTGLEAEVFYYYGGNLPTHLENYGALFLRRNFSFYKKIKRKLGFTTFSPGELSFIRSLRKNKIQLVLAQYGPVGHRLVKICRYLNIPLITHFHGYDASVYSVIENCHKYREVFNYSKFVIAVSTSMQKHLRELGCPEEKLVYNPCGPDEVFMDVDPKFSKAVFIGVGRFVDKKAPYYTILAFKKVYDRFPEAKLIIGGTGELFESCSNIVRALALEDAVLLPGIIDRIQFVQYLSEGLAFVQHSVTAFNGDQEGTPVAVLEASAAGLPVISTHHAGIPDVIIEGETGFLVEEHDIEGMARKMIQLMENRTLAKEMGTKGKERIKKYFTLEKHLRVLDKLIIDLIQKNE